MTTVNRPNHLRTRQVFMFDYPSPGTSAAPVAATGTIVCAANTAAADGDTVTVGDGIKTPVVFEYDKSANGVSGGHTSWAAGTTAASNATALAALIAAAFPDLTVVDDLAGTLTLTHKIPGVEGNVTILHSGAVTTTVTGLAGGAVSLTTGATAAIKLMTTQHKMKIEKVEHINPTGLAADAANYWTLALKKGSTAMAAWSSLSSAEGAIAVNTPQNLTLDATLANRITDVGDVLSLGLTKTASAANLPAGHIAVHVLYL